MSDVFGIRTSEFYRPASPPEISLNGKVEKATIGFYEVLEAHTAKATAMFANTPGKSPAITVNNFGKGRAIYVAFPAQTSVLGLVHSLHADLRIEKGPETPSGVHARAVEGRTLYLNTTADEKTVTIRGATSQFLRNDRLLTFTQNGSIRSRALTAKVKLEH